MPVSNLKGWPTTQEDIMQTADTDARSVATIGSARPAPVAAFPSR
jgi:hypothetical protein